MYIFFLLGALHSIPTLTQNKATTTQKVQKALNQLLKSNADARVLNNKAVAVLVFPNITKAGLMIGGQYGDGILLNKGKPIAYYNTTGVSCGLQIGAQEYGYAIFL
jgi:lipid-binding SYLF domain-containing protein